MTIQDRLHYAAENWKLTNISTIYEKETRAVYQADAAEWGKVIIKINADKKELFSEYSMLNAMKGSCCCAVFAFDTSLGIIAEEQIIPGNVLREEKNPAKRVEIFSAVFHNIHPTLPVNNNYKTYIDWLADADRFCSINSVDNEIKKNMQTAHRIGKELFKKYQERVLLHGDLHHDNILQSSNHMYCMIDPKGIIGPEIFDLPRFILNEFDFAEAAEAKKHISLIIQLISSRTGYHISDITKLLFMETMLAHVWNLEDGNASDAHHMKTAAELMEERSVF